MADDVIEDYKSSLSDLTFNSKPLINMLTMLAEENAQYAEQIVQVIEAHVLKAPSSQKLPAVYLADSIIKNVCDSDYLTLFTRNLVHFFVSVFEKVDEKTRQSMFKLRQTWNEIFPRKKLYALDVRVSQIDPAWPIASISVQSTTNPTNIHVNPRFLIKEEEEKKEKAKQEQKKRDAEAAELKDADEAEMRRELLAKQQELLKLQQQQLELELAEARSRLQQQAQQMKLAAQGHQQHVDERKKQQDQLRLQKEKQEQLRQQKVHEQVQQQRQQHEQRHKLQQQQEQQLSEKYEQEKKREHEKRQELEKKRELEKQKEIEKREQEKHENEKRRAQEKQREADRERELEKYRELERQKQRKERQQRKEESKQIAETVHHQPPPRSPPLQPIGAAPIVIPVHASQAGTDPRLKRDPRHAGKQLSLQPLAITPSAPQTAVVHPAVKHVTKRQQVEVAPVVKHVNETSAHNEEDISERVKKSARASPDEERRMTCSRGKASSRSRSRSPRPPRQGTQHDSKDERAGMEKKLARREGGGQQKEKEQWNGEPFEDQPPAKRAKSEDPVIKPADVMQPESVASLKPEENHKEEKKDLKLPDDLADLFGKGDQDYRQLPPAPVTPRQRIPSGHGMLPLPSPNAEEWAKFKADRPHNFPVMQPHDVDMRMIPAAPPTPDVGVHYSFAHDARWQMRARLSSSYEVVIDGRGYGMAIHSVRPRCLRINNQSVTVRVDWSSRRVIVDSNVIYQVGDPELIATFAGGRHGVYLRGPALRLWLDGEALDLSMDSPPAEKVIGGVHHIFHLDSNLQAVIMDNVVVASLKKPVQPITIDGRIHELRLYAPPSTILIDGAQCHIDFSDHFPVLRINGVAHGIRFDGPPRDIIVNGRTWTVALDQPRRVRLIDGNARPNILCFGGPGHEVIIDDQWYVVRFGGPEVACRLSNGRIVLVQLPGVPPEVKVLGEVLSATNAQKVFGPRPPVVTPPAMARRPPLFTRPLPPRTLTDPRLKPGSPHRNDLNNVPQDVEMGRQDSRSPPVPFAEPHHPLPRPPFPRPLFPEGAGSPRRDTAAVLQPNDVRPLMPHLDAPPPLPAPPLPRALLNTFQPAQLPPPLAQLPLGLPQLSNPAPIPPAVFNQQLALQQWLSVPGMPPLSQLLTAGLAAPFSIPPPTPAVLAALTGGVIPQNVAQPPSVSAMIPLQAATTATAAVPTTAEEPSGVNVSDLLSKLVAAGVINSQPDEKQDGGGGGGSGTPQQHSQHSNTSTPPPSTEPLVKVEVPVFAPKLDDVPDLTEFDVQKLKLHYPGVLQRLHVGMQCASCGVRFNIVDDDSVRYREHLDWHFRQNRRDKDQMRMAKFRRWYYDVRDWVQFDSVEETEEAVQSVYFEKMLQLAQRQHGICGLPGQAEVVSCPAALGNENDDVCDICGDTFEQFWDEEEEEWHLKDAVRVSGETYHPVCYEDAKETLMSEGGNALISLDPVEPPTPTVVTPAPVPVPQLPDPITNPLGYLAMLGKQSAANAKLETAPITVKTESTVTVITEPASMVKTETVAVKTESVAIKTEPVLQTTPAAVAETHVKMETNVADESKPESVETSETTSTDDIATDKE